MIPRRREGRKRVGKEERKNNEGKRVEERE